jgi:hypothetical protein
MVPFLETEKGRIVRGSLLDRARTGRFPHCTQKGGKKLSKKKREFRIFESVSFR